MTHTPTYCGHCGAWPGERHGHVEHVDADGAAVWETCPDGPGTMIHPDAMPMLPYPGSHGCRCHTSPDHARRVRSGLVLDCCRCTVSVRSAIDAIRSQLDTWQVETLGALAEVLADAGSTAHRDSYDVDVTIRLRIDADGHACPIGLLIPGSGR